MAGIVSHLSRRAVSSLGSLSSAQHETFADVSPWVWIVLIVTVPWFLMPNVIVSTRSNGPFAKLL